MHKVTIIIPTYNRKEYLEETLNYLLPELNHIYIDKLLVINNHSTPIYLKPHKKVKVINFRSTVGLLEMKNSALNMVNSKYTLILDDDLEFSVGMVGEFMKKIKYYNFDLCSGMVIEDNKYKFPDFIFFVKYCFLSFYKVGSLNYKKLLSKKAHYVDFLPGCLLFGKTRVIKKLGFDQTYIFPYFNEDTDITYRAFAKNYKLVIFPDIKVKHLRVKKGGNRAAVSKEYWYYAFGFNNSYFINKNFNLLYYLLYSIFRCRDHLHVLKQGDVQIYKNYIKGIYDGYKKT